MISPGENPPTVAVATICTVLFHFDVMTTSGMPSLFISPTEIFAGVSAVFCEEVCGGAMLAKGLPLGGTILQLDPLPTNESP